MNPLVSILVPAYNSEQWIAATILSAINQTYKRKEVIVVDDGSKDNTLSLARGLQSTIVKVVAQPNGGACSARNHALRLAQGDFIQWLDADDLLHPEKIALQMGQFQGEPNGRILLSSSFGTFYYRCSKARFIPNSLWRDLSPIQWFVSKFSNDDSMFPGVWLISRHLTENVGLWDESLSMDDDGEYFGRVIASCEKVRFVPQAKSFYRQANPQSISKTINHRACHSLFLSYKNCINYMLSLENSETTRSSALKYLQANLIYFYPEEADILAQLMELARQLGGDLRTPQFSRKYMVFRKLLGLHRAKVIASSVRGMKQYLLKRADQVMCNFDNKSGDSYH
jgi:glycosyltransferase involved in cell wall biosynthesis